MKFFSKSPGPALSFLLMIAVFVGWKYYRFTRADKVDYSVEISHERVRFQRLAQPFLLALYEIVNKDELSAEQRAALLRERVPREKVSEVSDYVRASTESRTTLFVAVLREQVPEERHPILSDVLAAYGACPECPDKVLFENMAGNIRALSSR